MGASTLRLELVMPLSQQALLIAVTNYDNFSLKGRTLRL
jgi:hypothetical protein